MNISQDNDNLENRSIIQKKSMLDELDRNVLR